MPDEVVPDEVVPDSRHFLHDRYDIPVVHVTHFSQLIRNCGRAPTTFIKHLHQAPVRHVRTRADVVTRQQHRVVPQPPHPSVKNVKDRVRCFTPTRPPRSELGLGDPRKPYVT
ncbi:hypothetical protein [Actinomadura sp. 6N118]|uniref:hypothetical protein n=1 Tax=Actinomadura sp. 6N118 TaxID=3375151 RepID=UPI00379BC6BA